MRINGRQAVLGSERDDLREVSGGKDVRHHHESCTALARKFTNGTIDLCRALNGCCYELYRNGRSNRVQGTQESWRSRGRVVDICDPSYVRRNFLKHL